MARTGTIDLAISPDGRRIVYVARSNGRTKLFVRPLNDVDVRPIPGTEGTASFPFFSADGEWVGFFADDKLKKVSLKGGLPTTICNAGSHWFGGAWNAQNTIVFSTDGALHRVSAAGGQPESLATPDPDKGESVYRCPKFLPGGKALLFDVGDTHLLSQVRVLSLETGEQRTVVEKGINAYYASTGHLVYRSGRKLMAAPFDLASLEIQDDSIPMREEIRGVDYAISGNGTLVYVLGRDLWADQSILISVDREGRERVLSQESRKYRRPRPSLDGKQVALIVENEEENGSDVWIYDSETDVTRRLTFDGERKGSLSWTPDGKWITFVLRGGRLYRKRADGSRPTELLLKSPVQLRDLSWSPDRSAVAVSHWGDIWVLRMEEDKKPQPWITSSGKQRAPVFSPDGQYLAYVSTETGLNHVFVTPYPESDVKWLISDEEGGGEPVWSPDRRELFYRSASPGGKMMVVPIATEPTFKAGKPRVLFEGEYFPTFAGNRDTQFYDISPDGQHFLMIKESGVTQLPEPRRIHVVENWFNELQYLVPTDQ